MIDQIREAYSGAAVTFWWEKDDILMVDNVAVAYGRAPFAGPREVIALVSDARGGEGSPADFGATDV